MYKRYIYNDFDTFMLAYIAMEERLKVYNEECGTSLTCGMVFGEGVYIMEIL